MQIFNALFVLIPIVIAGSLSRKFNILSNEHLRGLSAFVYYFALPALFLEKIANLNLNTINLNLLIGAILPIFITIFLLFLLKTVKIINKKWFVLLALSVVFSSNAFFGVAFFEALLGKPGLDFMIVISSVMGPMGIILSLMLFEYATQKKHSLLYLLKILRNPLIIAILTGLFLSITKIQLGFLFSSLEMLGKTAAPTAIFTLGMFMYDRFQFKNLRPAILPALFRLICFPIVTLLTLTYLLDPEIELLSWVFLQSGIPVAISIFIFAERYNYEAEVLSNIIILTSIGSFIVLPVIFFFSGV